MGVVTGTLFKGLNFGGIDSRDYGVYITGEAVYNAPVRDVEMITVPGRNGAYALDRGRFENITVTYPAGMMEGTAADFADNISDFRNALAALTGYQRLTDDYNPAEYRQAVYTGGLEVEAATGHNAGEFEIVFECKPQRFLTSGEDEIAVTSGDTVTNPTLFDSHPLLAVTGYGTINIGGGDITLANVPIGYVTPGFRVALPTTIDQSLFQTGDPVTIGDIRLSCTFENIYGTTISSVSNVSGGTQTEVSFNGASLSVSTTLSSYGITVGSYSVMPVTVTFDINNGSNSLSVGFRVTYTVSTSELWLNVIVNPSGTPPFVANVTGKGGVVSSISGVSSVNSVGNPAFIDLDIGEAYKVEAGEIVSINKNVRIPALLPTLTPGANTVTFSNTFTDVKITPRWWKV